MFDLLMFFFITPVLLVMKWTYQLLMGIKWLIETPVKAIFRR